LNRTFSPRDEFADKEYELLPFKFLRLDGDRRLLTNLVGEYLILSAAEFGALLADELAPNSQTHADLAGRHFIATKDSRAHLELLATKYRTRLARRPYLASLHLFVVTLRCDHSCSYCQVSRVSEDKAAYDMTEQTADRAIDIMLESPSPNLKIEFQGGESLLNFPLILHIVARVKRLAADRALNFVITSNLSQLTEEMVEVCAREGISFSTSLDGPEHLHNANRPRPGHDSYARTLAGIEIIRQRMGSDAVSALMTATSASLAQPEAIIDEYVRLGFRSIFLRFISPYGFAVKSHARIGYETQQYIEFYKRGLAHILQLNQSGTFLRETYSTLLLGRILTPFSDGYVDLQSPAGLGLNVLAYNYDGGVYASDEGRMMAEMGNDDLRLGTIDESYRELIMAKPFQEMLMATMTEGMPGCSDCAFQPWCGSDPSFHLRTQGDPVGHRPTSAFCQRQMAIFYHLIELLEVPSSVKILRSWLR
jgi:His-Xaa-Ser system radical SAM maturase HxsB